MRRVAKTHVIEYTPYDHRNERCAVGLLCLLDDGTCTAHIAQQLRKAKAIDPACDVQALRDGLISIAAEISENQKALSLYQSGFGGIRITSNPGTINYSSDEEFENGIKWSMAAAVEPIKPQNSRERSSTSRLFLEVKNAFDSYGWMGHMGQTLEDHRIIPRYQLLADEGLAVDFALQNGVLHCMQTVDYRHNPGHKRNEANAKLLTLGLATQLTKPDTKRYAVLAGMESSESKAGLKLAERVSSDVFINESSEDMSRLFGIMTKAMGQEPMEELTT